NGRLGLDCTTLSPTAQAFTPRHLAQAFESLAVSTVAVACSLRSSRVHPTLSPTSTPFPFAHRQKIRACSQGGQPQQPTSWAQTFKSPPIGHFSRFLHRAQFPPQEHQPQLRSQPCTLDRHRAGSIDSVFGDRQTSTQSTRPPKPGCFR